MKASLAVIILVVVASIASSPPIEVRGHNINVTLVHGSVTEYRGHYYPNLTLRLDPCPQAGIEVYRGGINITDLALSSGMVEYVGCILRVDGLKLKPAGYIDDDPLVIKLNGSGLEITLGSGTPVRSVAEPGRESGEGHAATPVREDIEEDGQASLYTDILVGISLALLLIASVVYEYGAERGSRSIKAR